MAILRRGKKYYLVKRVPKEYGELDSRRIVQIALKTDSETEAKAKAPGVEAALEAYWVALSDGSAGSERFKAMVVVAASRGIRYKPAGELIQRGLGQVLGRVEGVSEGDEGDKALAGAMLGPLIGLGSGFPKWLISTSI